MILSRNTNTVYFSRLLSTDSRFKTNYDKLTSLLNKYKIPHKLLEATADIWCRDYMPIQTAKKQFVQFRYEPSYLTESLELQSDPEKVCEANRIYPKISKINLDGGNIVNWTDRAIITDRIFTENPQFSSKTKLIFEVEDLLGVEIIVIPQINLDMTGHADGLVRFVDRNTILGNNRKKEYKYWKKGINKVLSEYGINYIDIPFLDHKEKNHPNHAIGCYVNYLEVGDLIVLPIFETPDNKDNEAIKLFENIFSDRKIETINFNSVGLHGGLLNCTTWTIEE